MTYSFYESTKVLLLLEYKPKLKSKIMKSIIVKTLFLVVITTSFSCKKEEVATPQAATPTPTSNDGFFYSENGSTTLSIVTTPYASAQYNSIFAVNSGTTVVEMNLTSIAVGTYTIDANNALTYLKTGVSGAYIASAGSVTITANASNKLTGTFTSTGSGITGVTSFSGSFTNIVIQ